MPTASAVSTVVAITLPRETEEALYHLGYRLRLRRTEMIRRAVAYYVETDGLTRGSDDDCLDLDGDDEGSDVDEDGIEGDEF